MISYLTTGVPPVKESCPSAPTVRRDILVLAQHILRSQGIDDSLCSETLNLLYQNPWPGNVRELKRVLNHAAVFHEKGPLSAQAVHLAINDLRPNALTIDASTISSLDKEILRISHLSPKERGAARRRLGMAKSTFYRKMKYLCGHSPKSQYSGQRSFQSQA